MNRDARSTGGGDRESHQPVVDVESVVVGYDELTVLDGVSLDVEGGEFVGLVGPNGAGKTTLIETINGIQTPASGTVRVAGDAVHELDSRAASRRVATVPQETTVAFDFAVEDVVDMGRTPYHGRLSGDPDAQGAVDRALERTETAEFRNRSVRSLSGGERQRVLLARALAQETPALLLDEPTASLDINHQVRTLELVRDLVDEEHTAVLAAIHDLDLAARFCDRLALLADGELLAVGPPDEVLRDESLSSAFDTRAAVVPNPVTGTPTVTPIEAAESRDCRCHVVGTGEATARAVAALIRDGCTVTVGAVPEADVAAVTAHELAESVVTAPPFASLGDDAVAATRAALDEADVAVLVGTVSDQLAALAREHDALVEVDPADIDASVEAVTDRSGVESGSVGGVEGVSVAGDGSVDRPLAERIRRAVEQPGRADD